MRVVAVVVTFNRKELLLECIEGLARQTHPLERVIVVDNDSTDGTPEALAASDLGDRVPLDLVRVTRNGGGSEGFHYGLVEAVRGESDWVWLMDDDCEPVPDALEQLLASPRAADPAVIGLGPKVEDPERRVLPLHRGHITPRSFRAPLEGCTTEEYARDDAQVDFFSFVGPMFRTSAVRAMGPSLREAFIRFEDLEYSARARGQGDMWLVNSSVVLHKEGVPLLALDLPTMWRNFSSDGAFGGLWKVTYGLRNMIWAGRRHGFISGPAALTYVMVQIVRILLFGERKRRSIRMTATFAYDGWRGLFRNVVPGRWRELAEAPDPVAFLNREALRYDRSTAAPAVRIGATASTGAVPAG